MLGFLCPPRVGLRTGRWLVARPLSGNSRLRVFGTDAEACSKHVQLQPARCSVNGAASAHTSADDTTGLLDVSSVTVNPVYRSIPSPKRSEDAPGDGANVRVLFVSEGNVCRSVIAEAVFRGLVQQRGLADFLHCESKAVRDYNLGEPADALAVGMAAQCGLALNPTHCARMLHPAEDIADFDLLLVMDKFNAADVLKEVSVFDTIDPTARYSSKVRRLGEFCRSREVGDIDDPLYGNMGDSEELEKLSEVVTDIQESCAGLLEELVALRSALPEGGGFCQAVRSWLHGKDNIDWLVPPMLQKRTSA